MNNHRIIIVSNRLPFQFTEKKGQMVITPSSGGLVSSLKSYVEKRSGSGKNGNNASMLWVGHSDISEKKIKEHYPENKISVEDFELHPVSLPAETKDQYYNGFSNDTIWPLFHYFPSYAKFKESYYRHYRIANNLFCEKLVTLYQPGDQIWIHDYHLMLLPAMVRSRLPEASVGFFLHIPFPSFELFRLLPAKWRKEILEGMLGADLVGFHTNDYLQHFLHSIRQILGFDNLLHTVVTPERSITVDSFPISIDFNKFYNASSDTEVYAERNRIKKNLLDRKLIVSVDRLDYTKGIINRLEGFELFFEKYPEYKGKVKFILIVVPSRAIINQYKESKKKIEGLVSKINGKYGNFDWTPVVYQYKSIDFKKMTGMYLAADAALITPLRDGMNLVAKEFIATRNDKRGVLILSETAGAASELGEAIIINPTDRNDIADALHLTLNMPVDEQVRRNTAMQSRIRHYDVVKWADDFIFQLKKSRIKQESLKIKEVTPALEEKICRDYVLAKNRLIFLDYDGTLTPISKLPHLAAPAPSLKELITSLQKNERNTIVLISGRSKEVLENWFGEVPVNIVAEHGALFRAVGRGWQQMSDKGPEWKKDVLPVFEMYTERCAGSFIEEKAFSVAWHYRNSEKDLAFVRSRELINELSELSLHLDFQVINGNKVIEARTRGNDKGTAATRWLTDKNYDFVLAIGDDTTDEDLFRILPPQAVSIRVGLVQSAAKYNFKFQRNVLEMLNKLLLF